MKTMVLGSGDLEVELLPEVGGRIHRIRVLGRDVLRCPEFLTQHVAEPFFWGSYPMVPWANRIPWGRLSLENRTAQLPCNLEDYAIHGEAYERPWSVAGDGHLRFDGGMFGYRWPYRSEQHFEVTNTSLRIRLSLTNIGKEAMPGGIGFHPWFDASTPLHIRLPADLVYPNVDCIPSGDPVAVSGSTDLRRLGPVTWELDEPWTGLTDRTIDLHWPQLDMSATYTFGDTAACVVLAAFERFSGVAIEPITQVPGHPRAILPGETLVLDHELTIR